MRARPKRRSDHTNREQHEGGTTRCTCCSGLPLFVQEQVPSVAGLKRKTLEIVICSGAEIQTFNFLVV